MLAAPDLRQVPLAKAYNPDQPRVPAGNPNGGQWGNGDGTTQDSSNHESEVVDPKQPISPPITSSGASTAGSRQTTPYPPPTKQDLKELTIQQTGSKPVSSIVHSYTPVDVKDDQGNQVFNYAHEKMQMPSDANLSFFVEMGLGTLDLADAFATLSNFRQNGIWDIQRVGFDKLPTPAFVDVATVAIGLYSAAAGIPLSVLLWVENQYAKYNSNFGDAKMDDTYNYLPARNVWNTKLGYELYETRRIGP